MVNRDLSKRFLNITTLQPVLFLISLIVYLFVGHLSTRSGCPMGRHNRAGECKTISKRSRSLSNKGNCLLFQMYEYAECMTTNVSVK